MKKDFLGTPIRIVRIISHYEPIYLFLALPQIVIYAVLPLLSVHIPKQILEALTEMQSFENVVQIILCYGVLLLLLNIGGKLLTDQSHFAAERFTKKLRFEIGKITAHLELSDMESASQRELIHLANHASRLPETLSIVQKIVANMITITGLAVIAVRLDVIFFVAVAMVLAVKTVFTCINVSQNQKKRKLYAENEREGDYLYGLAYFHHGAEKELRVNHLQSWFMGKIKQYRGEMLRLQYADFRRHALFEIMMAILTSLESFVILVILCRQMLDGNISIAEFTMYFSATVALTSALSSLTDQIGNYQKQRLHVADYQKLIHLSRQTHSNTHTALPDTNISEHTHIVFEDVSFRYPGSDNYALRHVNLTISDREKLVIVGLNGAGKTTLIKLLCKFYVPSEGRITWNGVDIQTIPDEIYFRMIAAVFQDYRNFAFSLAENIALTPNADRERIRKILRELNMGQLTDSLPDGLDTYISKNFSRSGIELSGGENQKLAIARAVYQNASLLILDEPTASLDAKAESEIYSDFFRLSQNKTTIFISHRLAASTVADHIAVFENGRIIEYGDHVSLLRQGGLYADMVEKQSRPYVNPQAIF